MINKDKIKKIVFFINENIISSNSDGFIFGLSGGIDSALIAAIAANYFPKNHLAVLMNIENTKEDVLDQQELISFFNLNYQDINLTEVTKIISKDLKLESSFSGNLKSRLRMVTLYSLGQKLNYLVLGTSNLNEIFIGYFTKYGDGASDILPLANLTKYDIWALSKELNVPQKIIEKKPSAGFSHNQTDEEEIGITYKEMEAFFRGQKVSSKIILRMNNFNKTTQHKREFPKTIKKNGTILGNINDKKKIWLRFRKSFRK